MFDTKVAVKACFEAFPSKEARTFLAQFIQNNLVNRGGIITQCRTYGKEADIIHMFLTKSGLSEGIDFVRRTSALDDKVIDFRWTTEGAFASFREIFNDTNALLVPRMLRFIWGDDPIEPETYLELLPTRGTVTTASGTDSLSDVFRVEEVTIARCKKFIESVEGNSNATGEDKNLAAALKESDCAIPNLGTIEHILRYFGEIEAEVPALFNSGATMKQHKTVLRHITKTMVLPSQELLVSTIVPFAFDNYECATESTTEPTEESPINSFFYRTREKSAKESLRSNPVFVSAFEELNPEFIGTSLLRASHLQELWSYVRDLYNKFFNVHAQVLGCSRLVLNNVDPIWVNRPRPGSCRSFAAHFELMADSKFISSPSAPAGVNVTLVIGTNVYDTGSCQFHEGVTDHVKYHVEKPEYKDPNTYARDHIPTSALSDEWFSLVHCAGRDLVPSTTCSPSSTAAPSREDSRKNLAGIIKRSKANLPKSVLIKRTNFEMNDQFLSSEMPLARCTMLNDMMQGLVMAVRKYGYTEKAGYSFWKKDPADPYADVHAEGTVISAIYSGIESPETYMGKLSAQDDPHNFTEFIKGLPEHQRDPVTVHGLHTRTMIIETNVAVDDDNTYYDLACAVKRLAVVNMLCNQHDYNVALKGKYSAYMPRWPNVEHAASSVAVLTHISKALDTDHMSFPGCSIYSSSPLARIQDAIRQRDNQYTFSDGFRSSFSVEAPSTVCSASIRVDEFKRIYIVLRFTKSTSFIMMAMARMMMRINPLDAFTRSLIREGNCIAPSDSSEEALYKSVFKHLYDTDIATDYGQRGLSIAYGIGPMFREHNVAEGLWPTRHTCDASISGGGLGIRLPIYW